MVEFRSSPEDAAAYAADKILENRKISLWPRELKYIFCSKKWTPLLLGMLALLFLVQVYFKGEPEIPVLIDILSFLITYTLVWESFVTVLKYVCRKEALKPEYDWAVEYKILHESDQELDLIEELPE